VGLAPLPRTIGAVDERGSLFGHPGGGDLRESPVRIAEQIVARGTNITHTAATEREVYVLAAVTAPGDSGAPVVDTSGRVVGVVFAFDISRETTAYALTDRELDAVLRPVLSGTASTPKGTGPCLPAGACDRAVVWRDGTRASGARRPGPGARVVTDPRSSWPGGRVSRPR